MADFGKTLVFFGVILPVLGVLFLLLGRTSLPVGRLPGDILYRGKNTTFYFPFHDFDSAQRRALFGPLRDR
jgi:hypothetical protein